MKTVEPMADGVRYRRLRLLGCAPTESENLKNGTVLRFTNLDRFVDADLVNYPNRGDKPFEQAESLAELALRNIACFLGVGGHNAPLVDVQVYEEKILDAIAHPTPPPSGEREKMGDLQDRCCVALEKDDDELRADAELGQCAMRFVDRAGDAQQPVAFGDEFYEWWGQHQNLTQHEAQNLWAAKNSDVMIDIEAVSEARAIAIYEAVHDNTGKRTPWAHLPPGEWDKWRRAANVTLR